MATDVDAATALLNELADVSTERRLMLAYETMLRQRQIELFVQLRTKPTDLPYEQIAQAAATDTKTIQRAGPSDESAMRAALKQETVTEMVQRFVKMTRMDPNSIRQAVFKARRGRPSTERRRPSPVEWPRVRGNRA